MKNHVPYLTLSCNSITQQINMLAPRVIRTSTLTASIWTCAFCQSTRAFRSSALHGARPVVKKERAKHGAIPNEPRGPGLERDAEAFWPIALLKSAKASGALQIGPKDAVSFLERYARLARNNDERLQKLCQGSQCSPLYQVYIH